MQVRDRARRAIVALLFLTLSAGAQAQSNTAIEAINRGFDVRSVPAPTTTQRMTPEQWRRRQLAAVDKSQKILLEARQLPGMLGQFLKMQAAYEHSDEVAFRLVFGQYVSWYRTFVGDYDAARSAFSPAQKAASDDAPSPLAAGMSAQSAAAVVLRLAQARKAIFFNEAHSAPVTRTLTVELLAGLREQGFDTFAAETLYTTDHDLGRRGYPTGSSGFYVAEPIYGEMVRAALRLGYRVIAYDAENEGIGEAREKAGAEALVEQTFKRDPKTRLVLNAGFGHIQKAGAQLGGKSMAEWFTAISGIEPLAVEQTMLSERARADQEHPWYRAAMTAPHPDQPFVYVDESGKPWTLRPGQYDVSVFFPRSVEHEGRPTWPGLDRTRLPHAVDASLCPGVSECLVEARYASEGEDAIPADRLILGGPASPAQGERRTRGVLYLFPGRYRLRACDSDNHVLSATIIDVAAADQAGKAGR